MVNKDVYNMPPPPASGDLNSHPELSHPELSLGGQRACRWCDSSYSIRVYIVWSS